MNWQPLTDELVKEKGEGFSWIGVKACQLPLRHEFEIKWFDRKLRQCAQSPEPGMPRQSWDKCEVYV